MELGEDGQPADAGVEDADRARIARARPPIGSALRERRAIARGDARRASWRPGPRPGRSAHSGLELTKAIPSLLDASTRRPSETTSKSIRLPSACSTSPLSKPPDASARLRTVASLDGRIADGREGLRRHRQAADGHAVVREHLEDQVRRVEEDEDVLAQRRASVDDDELVQLPQEREDLLDVSRRHHLSHLDAGWCEQDVDPRRVAPHHVGEVRLANAIGRQVDDARRDGWDAQQPAQVAELERAVDQADAVVLPERDRHVVGERRSTDAALRAEQGDHEGAGARRLRRARVSPTLRIIVVRSKPVNGIVSTASIAALAVLA